MYAWAAAAILAIAGTGGVWIQQQRVEAATEKAAAFEMQYQTMLEALRLNDRALTACRTTNNENATRYAEALERAKRAEAEALQSEGAATERVNQIHQEAQDHAADTECRTLVDPLPADFVRWLRD